MKAYFAGAEAKLLREELKRAGVRNILLSFYYFNDKNGEKMREVSRQFDSVFLDSGGFSARVRGVEISVEDYRDYINAIKSENINIIYANLDVKTYEETLKNQRFLEANGLNPIPVYHYSEYNSKDREVLLDYIKTNKYIAIGGVSGVSLNKTQKKNYFNYVFKNTKQDIKVHGFGITSRQWLTEYPFYSCDSTTWQSRMKFGATSLRESERLRITKNKTFRYNDSKLLAAEIKNLLRIEDNTTRIWEKRGVVWKD